MYGLFFMNNVSPIGGSSLGEIEELRMGKE